MTQQPLIEQLFLQQFNYASTVVCHAPGRVNIIGDHTDYNDGFVLPAAINYGTTIAAAKRDDNIVRVYAHDCGALVNEFNLNDISFEPELMWSNYVRGTLQALMKSGAIIGGADLAVTGNVPQGAGLSSSASFEVAILKTFASMYQLDLDGIKAALLGQQAENEFVGCNCGIMDQLISAMGKDNHAMMLDCKDLSFEDAPIPPQLSLFIVNSNVKRGLVDSEYNLRREQCEQVAQHFGKTALREVTLTQLNAAKSELDETLFKRARHVISENMRVEAALVAMRANDVATLSGLMKASHESLRDDFAVTTKELDGLVRIIDQEVGLAGGVRMTGGGFGGCVVALVPTEIIEQLTRVVVREYPQQYGLKPSIYICEPSQGAFRE